MSKATQRGFTLIELVVVIVILGILAAFAVPRFINLQDQARAASRQALEGSVRSASALAHAVALATGQTGATGTVDMDGTSVPLVNGYPSLAGIALAIDGLSGYGYNATTGVFSQQGAPDADTCGVTYAEAATGAAPSITPNTAGC